jgi:parallel beta-helix repeat protein
LVLLVVGFLLVPVAARTLRVAKDGSGSYSGIQAAIDSALAGDEVYVAAGVYTEAIVLREGVTVRGEGRDRVTITFAGDSHVVTAQGVTSGRVEGMTLSHTGTGDYGAVFLEASNVTIAGCVLTSAGWCAIGLRACALPIIENNVIRNGKYSGVFIYGGGTKGTVRNNEIYGNGLAGIEVYAGADPLIESNVIRDGKEDGIFIRGSGTTGTVRNNEIYGNALSGIEVKDGAAPLVEGNVIRDGKHDGILIWRSWTKGTVRNNKIYGNGFGGIAIGEFAAPLIDTNTIVRNKRDGIWAYHSASPLVTNNIIALNDLDGVNTTAAASGGGSGSPILSHNDVWNNKLLAYRGVARPATDISADPLFVDAEHGDFSLKLGSPCIGAGEGGANIGASPVRNGLPLASFTWQVLSSSGARLAVEPRTGDRISFDASRSSDPDGRIVSYEWDWESNGSFDAKQTSPMIEHTFSTSGSQRVTLRVTDDQGATGSVTQTVSVGERQAPQALFAFSPTQPSVVDAVHFADQSSDAEGQVVSWKWEFGDGTPSADRNPTHTYSRKGTFTVKLTVTDNDGLTGVKTLSLTVVNLPPDASFTSQPPAPVVGQSVRFDGSASTDRDGTISSYAWDFNGDGKTDATGMDATWPFVEAETYAVTLSVVDSDGATGTAKKDVAVSAVPSGPPRFQQQWGLVIGVGDYEDPTIPDLNYTEADAQAFYGFLTSPQGGGFQKDHVRFLLNEQATSTAVKGAFSWLIDQAGADDLVVIYFAGHGGTAKDTSRPPDEADGVDEYLVTYDARTADLFSTAVRDDEMADWLASFQSDHVVVILDSCFASGATRSLEQTGTRAGPGNRVFNDLVGPGRLFLAASQEAELSYEDGALGHGVFTYYLLRGLGALNGTTTPEADADQDGRVTVEELRIYLECEVTRARPQQHPLVTGDLALTRVALGGYGEPLLGEVTALDGDRVIISLGTRHGVQPGDRFEVVGVYALPDGTTMRETRATIEVLFILGPDRSVCRIVEQSFPIEVHDVVTPAP